MCWIYADDAEFDAAAQAFFAGGMARGERVLCVGERVLSGLRTTSRGHPDLQGLIARGAVETLTLAQVYEATGPFRSEQQLAYYGDATRRAVVDGYRGLRVIAEVSGLVTDPLRRPELVRWEQIADDFAASGAGFSAMCAYRADLPAEALADVAAVHPLVHAPRDPSAFALFAEGDRVVLTGSVDAFSCERLGRLLDGVPVAGELVVLDLGGLEFLDVASSRVLARWVARLAEESVAVHVRGASRLLRRMWPVLQLDRVAPLAFLEPTA